MKSGVVEDAVSYPPPPLTITQEVYFDPSGVTKYDTFPSLCVVIFLVSRSRNSDGYSSG